MSYEDTNCPCRGRKPRETMLCDECLEFIRADEALERDLRVMNNETFSMSYRRSAAVRLLTAARRRKQQPRLALVYQG